MDKRNLKKAALLGLMIGAAAVSAPASAHEPVTSQGMTLAAGCGGGCGGRRGNIANADEPVQTQPGTNHSCGGAPMPQNGRNGRAMPQGTPQPMPQATPQQMPQASCGTAQTPQGYYYNSGTMPQSGCRASAGCRSNGYGY